MEGRKKVLINCNDLTVGIYKYFKLRELTPTKLRKIFNELVAYAIGKSLGLPIAKVIFHFEPNTIGIISELVTPPVYTFKDLENINIIEEKSLIEMIAFDIFIYNTDRHAENICFTKINQEYIPKLIDHSSSLGGYEKNSIRKLTSNPVMMVPYNLIGLGKIVNDINSFNVFKNIIKKIKLLDIEKAVKKAINQKELLVHIKANNVYDNNFEKEIIKGLKYRKENIESIIKKSFDL